ncbi:MAG: 2-hydroxyacid dehydrogenase [Pseudomonadota bacterium]
MSIRIAFAGSFSAQLAEPVRSRLTGPCDVITDDEASIAARLRDVDVLVSMGFSRKMADAAPKLKLVQVPGAGLERIDRSALQAGLLLANVYGHEAGIAEYVLGAMIALTRSFVRLDRELRAGNWESQWVVGRPPPPLAHELAGKTMVVLGLGHIGMAVAHRAAAFDMRVLAVRRDLAAAKPDSVARVVGLGRMDEVLTEADFVVVTLPVTDATSNVFTAERFARMKPTAYLINVARGEIVNEDALYDALASNRIAGAAIDVWYQYPKTAEATLPATRPFHKLDNVLMTPHVSGWTDGMLDARAAFIAENIERVFRGELPLNAIDPL